MSNRLIIEGFWSTRERSRSEQNLFSNCAENEQTASGRSLRTLRPYSKEKCDVISVSSKILSGIIHQRDTCK
ncbi:hypothetical protein A6X21_10615 [Planctopirus hydrillae]|uniref:Uncharacterized protein n=1 Tax=Planctopirus hydrillae TaxID=1841610 RepID=A0A1C3E6R9_9PLAN|nr:hypothetical protein A6X21_10615 [Planctopirus hydrillae]